MSSLSPLLPDYLPGKFIPARSGDEDVYENVQLHRLCAWCESIKDWVKENLPKAQSQYENGDYTFDARVGVTLRSEVHPTGNELLLSGRKGCHLCSMMWYSVQGHMDRKGLELRERLEQKFYGIYMDIYSSTSSSMSRGPRLLVDVGLYDRSRSSYEDLAEGLYVEFASPTSWSLSSMPALPVSTSSSTTIQWLDDMIKQCLSTHSECRVSQQNSMYLPTRVIDVGTYPDSRAERVHIICPAVKNIQGRYTTLSYCWGGKQDSCLKRANFKKYQDPQLGIDVPTLPKTLQDAILVTRRLGIRFLWVDSLCIIQDDPEDWRHESATMYYVYQRSYLTIAALKSDSSKGGLFALRNPLVYQPCRFFDDVNGNTALIYHHSLLNDISDTLLNSPLRKRAWVFQELALSPRTVYFGDFMVWECRAGSQSDMRCGDNGCYDLFLKKFSVANLSKEIPRSVLTPDDHKEFILIWNYAVAFYTEADLTNLEDRQVAIAGVIQSITERTGFQSFAGIWEPTFLYHLLWLSACKGSIRNGNAPSWSWLSLNGPITFDDRVDFFSNLTFFQPVALLCETPVITEEHDIGERKIRLVGEAVISVYPLKIISITTSKSEKRDFDVILDSLPESPVPETKYPEVHLDCGSIPPSDSDLYFAPLVLGTFGLPDPSLDLAHWIGLIVERLPRDPEVYQRVGCMFYETDAKKKRRTDLENHRKSITLV